MTTRVKRKPAATSRAAIIDATLELLETRGYDALQLRAIAKHAHVSLSTIYKDFSSRDQLVIEAVEHWMASHVYQPLTDIDRAAPLTESLAGMFRDIFEPWVQAPWMLVAFMRAQELPGGDRLRAQGDASVEPLMRSLFDDAEPDYVDDVMMILNNVVHAVVIRCADGDLDVHEIIPTLERTVFRLTNGRVDPSASGRG